MDGELPVGAVVKCVSSVHVSNVPIGTTGVVVQHGYINPHGYKVFWFAYPDAGEKSRITDYYERDELEEV
jgi:hypothetical protein